MSSEARWGQCLSWHQLWEFYKTAALTIETNVAAGAPLGNKNASKNRPWAEAINRALLAEDGKKLRALAEKLIGLALEGDVAALREIGDRVDGRPAQVLQGDPDNPLGFEIVERRIVDPKA